MNGEQMESEDYATFPDNMNGSRTYSWWGGYGGENGRAAYGGGLYGNIMDYRLTHDAKYTVDGFDLPTSPMNVGGFPETDVNCAWPWGPSLRPKSGQSAAGTGLDNNDHIMNWGKVMQKINNETVITGFQNSNVKHVTMERSSPYNYDTEDYNKAGSVAFLPRGGEARQMRTGIVSNAVTYGNIESISSSAGTAGDGGIDLGNSSCTIEWWALAYSSTQGRGSTTETLEQQTMVDFRPNNGYGRPHIYISRANDQARVNVSHGSNANVQYSNSTAILSGSWYHYAYVRNSSGYVKFFINGINLTYNESSGLGLYVGTANWSGYDARPFWGTSSRIMRTDSTNEGGNFNGLMTDCRVTVGTAVYTGNFTPPTKPLTTTGGTYPLSTNIASIGSGHVKQLLQFKNNPIKDTAGSQPFMAPTFTEYGDTAIGLPPKLVISDEDGISNWPANEPSALGGGSTTGKKYLYFYGGGSSSSYQMAKNFIAWPTNYNDSFVHSASSTGGISMFDEMPNSVTANPSILYQRRGIGLTLEWWIYPHQSNTGVSNHYLISYGDTAINSGGNGTFALRLEQQSSPGTPSTTGSNFGWILENNKDDKDFATGQSFNQWYHVALVFDGDGAEWRLFINGNRDTTQLGVTQTTNSLFNSAGVLSLGSDYLKKGATAFQGHSNSPDSAENFHGIVRNFRIDHRAKYWVNNFTPTDFSLE